MSEKQKHNCGWCGRAGWWGEEEDYPGSWVGIKVEVPGLPPANADLCDIECSRAWLEERGIIVTKGEDD